MKPTPPGAPAPEAGWLTPTEQDLVQARHPANRLGFALLLLFFRQYGRFPHTLGDIDQAQKEILVRQLGLPEDAPQRIELSPRTQERYQSEIRAWFGFRKATLADAGSLETWLCEHAATVGADPGALRAGLVARCREQAIEPPSEDRQDRLVGTALRAHEERLYAGILARLAPETRARLEALLRPDPEAPDAASPDAPSESAAGTAPAVLLWLRRDPGRPSLASVEQELAKLALVRGIDLPADLFKAWLPHDLDRYRRRVAVEAPHELRRHPEPARLAWLAAYVQWRGQTLVDGLVDLLTETIHRIGARAERRVERELLDDLKRVSGKQNLLFELAGAALDRPDGIVREVVFPVVSEQTLRDLVKEWKSTGPRYRTTLRTVIRNSYKGHYRRMVPKILDALEFRSNNQAHQPIIRALDLLKCYADRSAHRFPTGEDVPLDGIVAGLWREAVQEKDGKGRLRVNRVTYEICVLEALRDGIRCKEIWAVGAQRYRNPDEDLPVDFDTQRGRYYQALNLPLDAETFIATLQAEMREALGTLDRGLPGNRGVRIGEAQGGRITVTPFDPLPDPPNLLALKAEIAATWPMTGLLDMIKETDLRLNFTAALKSPTTYETLERAVLQPRLLLCLHGLGTNAGLQRMAGRHVGVTHKDLAYVRHRYITVEALRQAIALVTDGTLRARHPEIWGQGTTSCASDSKHFGAFDQNLTTQWHARYGGRGIMIYWHVERKSLCIHSQLKSPSSSEVASMIEGVVHHCTEMEVDRQYVDSHGQSTVAFAFCRLLGFLLMPRLKAIPTQKLSRPDVGQPDAYPNLQPILTKPIDWDLIRQQYDEMVKYATAVRQGTAETEAILRRFTKTNVQHPTYKAFAQLGKAVKTLFLCQYLHSEALRREINAGLNVVEHWNGATDFVFFARRGELASNRREDHEVSMLALHLLQNCLIYINTLMLQRVLAQPHWAGRLTPRDLSALTPLFWDHINPYGRYDLDMETRLLLD
ncbi:MAG: Tn3 family transposase [Methylomagnum sp.]